MLSLSAEDRADLLSNLSEDDAESVLYDWAFWRRTLIQHADGTWGGQAPPPGDWRVWLILAGRGYGKTWCGAQFTRWKVETGQWLHIALVAETAADARDVMVEGPSGILAISHPDFMPKYEPSKRRVTWPNGAVATTFSGDEPDQLRGPEHDGAWADEPAKWKYAQQAWDMLEMGLRRGKQPQVVATTTPRPIPLIKHLIADPATVLTKGNTYENEANLALPFIQHLKRRYEGTRLGRQELMAEILSDTPGALWKREQIEALRIVKAPALSRIVIGVDPGISSDEGADETGIIGAGVGEDGHGYVLDDKSLRGTPHQWASAAVTMYHALKADRIVAEANQGGEMVEHTIHTVDPNVPVKLVHASRGKYTRAEPVAAHYEQSRCHHVGTFPVLEDEYCSWTPGSASPNHLDAAVWALTDLLIDQPEPSIRFFDERPRQWWEQLPPA